MKNIALILIFTFGYTVIFCQDIPFADSMKKAMAFEKHDTAFVDKLQDISNYYRSLNTDSARSFALQALSLSNEIDYFNGKVQSLEALGLIFRGRGDIPAGLDYFFQGLQVAENNHSVETGAFFLINIGHVYRDIEDYDNAINYYKRANEILEAEHAERESAFLLWNIGNINKKINRLDSASIYKRRAYEKFKLFKLGSGYEYMMLGDIEFDSGNHALAFTYLQKSIEISRINKLVIHEIFAYITLAEFFNDVKQRDSCIYYANKGLALAKKMSVPIKMLEAYRILSNQYESLDIKEALYYRKIADSVRETLFGANKVQSLQKIVINEQERRRSIETANIAYHNKLKQYALMAGLLVFLVIAFLLFRNNRNKQKANKLLAATLANLKATQAQLIQSEKMASLGELTAGIAHEIQNPLNFVNNFSEVSRELIDELKSQKSILKSEEQDEILNDIDTNLEKINHHGKRADAIVKGMLQHSRISSGHNELTDINTLADEYFNLSYHGFRGKDARDSANKSVNITMQTNFDKTIEKIKIIPQDIGRVLLNLYNNAFYAVNEKSSFSAAADTAEKYEPTVLVSTKKIGNTIEIRVSDNGNGIPQKIIDKIFQPFFTTKPTGQGTGLGLSLAYDIVKAHGGELRVETKEGEGSEFTITIPFNK